MSTKTIGAFDLVPENARKGGPWTAIVTLFDAIGDGITAAHQYQTLVGRGMKPDEAARRVLETLNQKQ
ncbi:MAG TPA: hypothetical protein VNK52_01170 [Hyphomicrobiaceae bacterium]|nr:hypothetical protein [Hyphomicrobiaceae bacterium]